VGHLESPEDHSDQCGSKLLCAAVLLRLNSQGVTDDGANSKHPTPVTSECHTWQCVASVFEQCNILYRYKGLFSPVVTAWLLGGIFALLLMLLTNVIIVINICYSRWEVGNLLTSSRRSMASWWLCQSTSSHHSCHHTCQLQQHTGTGMRKTCVHALQQYGGHSLRQYLQHASG
jgi:hypothetical protein